MAFLMEYGMFLAKAATIVFAIAMVAGIIVNASHKPKAKKGQLEFTDLSKHYRQQTEDLQQRLLDKKAFKQWQKTRQKNQKLQGDDQPCLFLLEFTGSMDARETESLREEVSALLAIAKPEDEVLLRLESGGGVVHGYGLAASQLDRIRKQGIALTVAVDKVAASGGYMMACIGNKIIAAPFAILGSIGVIAQLPNFHKLLQKNHVDFEQFTAGEFKRTVTLFGENTEKGRQKFQQELEETHVLFKNFVQQHRPQLDVARVATGEHWFGYQALELQLVDTIQTSDDYLLNKLPSHRLFKVSYQLKKGLAEKVGMGSANVVSQWWQRLVQHNWQR
ncbi:inner membrane peptidase. Serine peptidase. MEROPS family S49 [Arsukibacterium tuosuense]|uniref:Inner membrane peptidase. Serine peptidase. MEROPS family S49 n=1 Tax=Arsukibacterium tuosuense TaxID=1323745 RepID=A0A285J643_9GAMM|nr:protease SohB [Arsukibacterium tuosuense]SNY55800.1 inner membrane peptidase. Serine peptidase. MEROPS family S49 [Arsukibacterium tuosuense]